MSGLCGVERERERGLVIKGLFITIFNVTTLKDLMGNDFRSSFARCSSE
jgi:hypothetical protein